MNQYQTDGALLRGPVVRPTGVSTGETLAAFPENTERLLVLNKRYRLRRHSDGWFVDGSGHRTQIWEYGPGRLGLTVTGYRMVAKCARLDWLTGRGIGDEEANFHCPWDDEHLKRLETLVRLQRRRSQASSEPQNS